MESALKRVAGGYTAVAAVLFVHFAATQQPAAVRFWFQEVGGPLMVLFAAIGASAGFLVWRTFEPGEPMRAAWTWLTAGAIVRFVSYFCAHILGRKILLNHLGLRPETMECMNRFGLLLGGTMGLAMDTVGLAIVVSVCWRLRLIQRLRAGDWLLVCSGAAYALWRIAEMLFWIASGKVAVTAFWLAGWLTDPALALLAVQAVLVRRAGKAIRHGMLVRCWSAYVAGILLTVLGNVGLWLGDMQILRPGQNWPFWLAWMPAACAFALAPVMQLSAVRFVLNRRQELERARA
jgi:hypothetical protein